MPLKLTEVKLRVLKKLAANGWTCAHLARQIGRTQTEVSHILNGKRHTRTVQEDIAKALGMSVGDLFGSWAWHRVAQRKLNEARRQAG